MKISVLIGIILVFAQTISANTSHLKLGGIPVRNYTIVYSSQADDNEGKEQAEYLRSRLQELAGSANAVKTDDQADKGHVISIGRLRDGGTFDYSVKVKHGKVGIEGGSSWAMRRAIDRLVDSIGSGYRKSSMRFEGTVDGEFLFPRGEGVNLRILDDNIWEYSADSVPPVWSKAGLDCRDKTRAPEFAQIVRAYMPDVLVLQEYSRHFDNEFYKLIGRYGYSNACDSGKNGEWNNTPVFYNADSLELIDVYYNLYTPGKWSNRNTKSYTSAVFRHKATGKKFAIINTHLWWQSDRMRAGSTFARASQVNLMLAEAELIRGKHDCPIFVTGDMNCEEKSMPMQQFVAAGYVPCYKVATVYGNRNNGHHVCAPSEVGERKSRRIGPDRETGAIDHCFIYNAKDAEVRVFDCIQDYFTVKLTDHYPNLVDVKL